MLELRHAHRPALPGAVEHDQAVTLGVATDNLLRFARFVPVHGRSIVVSARQINARPDIASVKWPTRERRESKTASASPMGVIDAYRRVLRNGPLTRLLVGEFVSSIGDWLYLVALLVVIWDLSKDPLVLGIVGAARILPYILLSIPAGIVADRVDRRLVLLVTDVIRGVIMLAIAAVVFAGLPVYLVVVLAVIATCFSAFFSPAIGAYLPSLVKDESELGPANSAWSSLDNLAFFIGPAFGALLLSLGSLATAFILNALTFGVVALVLLRLPASHPTTHVQLAKDGEEANADGEPKTPSLPGRPSYGSVLRPLSGLALLNIATGFVFGGLGVMTVVLAVNVFSVGDSGTGLLNSA